MEFAVITVTLVLFGICCGYTVHKGYEFITDGLAYTGSFLIFTSSIFVFSANSRTEFISLTLSGLAILAFTGWISRWLWDFRQSR